MINKQSIAIVLSILTVSTMSLRGQNNTNCENVITLTNNLVYSENTANGGSPDNPTTDPSGSPISHGVWFAITTPPYNVRLNVSTCGSSFNGNGNVNLILYTNACGGNPVTWVNGGGPFGCGGDGGVSFSASSLRATMGTRAHSTSQPLCRHLRQMITAPIPSY
ncbi:MAG TPA: hypothetical protein VH280_00615 [Verrucomicrobiae bacterium]|jgi:hypothetical protein|nr:hypothetical protein [Verrucomicrobiae bacterium]